MPELITTPQLRRLWATAREHGIPESEVRAATARLIPGFKPGQSLKTLTRREASRLTDILTHSPAVSVDRVSTWSDGAGRRYWRIQLAKSFRWTWRGRPRTVSSIEWYAHPGGEVYAYADSTGWECPPVDEDEMPADWPRPPADWLDGWDEERGAA